MEFDSVEDSYECIFKEKITLNKIALNDNNLEYDVDNLILSTFNSSLYVQDYRLIHTKSKFMYQDPEKIKYYIPIFPYISPECKLRINFNCYQIDPCLLIRITNVNEDVYLGYYKHKVKRIDKYSLHKFSYILEKKKEYEENEMCSAIKNQVLIPNKYEGNNVGTDGAVSYVGTSSNVGPTLFKYQRNDIEQMKKQEQGSNIKIIQSPDYFLYKDQQYKLNGYTIFLNKKTTPLIQNKYIKGGCLINEMGLGKTLECLKLIEETKDNNYLTKVVTDECNYIYKRGNKKGFRCIEKKSNLGDFYCKEHSKTPFIEKLKTELSIEGAKTIKSLNFYSHATLILCPTQLCNQWTREGYNSKLNLNIYMISTIESYNNLTLQELLFADVIILSYNFLSNDKYIKQKNEYRESIEKIWERVYKTKMNTEDDAFPDFFQNEIMNDKKKNYILKKKGFKLEEIKWKRIIVDEFHEINNKQQLQKINDIKTEMKWVVTGTPFVEENNSGKSDFKKYLNFLLDEDLCHVSNVENVEYELKNMFIRNTKNSVKDELVESEMSIITNFLNFNNYEKNIYTSFKEQISLSKNNKLIDMLTKICCCSDLLNDIGIMIKQCKTFEEIQNIILNDNERKLKKLASQKIILENDIITMSNNRDLDDLDNDMKLQLLGNFRRELTLLKKKYEVLNRGQNYLKSIIKAFENNEEWDCSICLDESTDIETIGITNCGHKFCYDCLNLSLENSNSCPQCKTVLRKDEYFKIKNQEEKEKTNLKCELNDIIENVKSTKIGNIIWDIKNFTGDDKCIIFSQWDDLLKKVHESLEKYDIKSILFKGSIYQKNKHIKKFKEKSDKTSILLLSSKNAASGLNLIEANKIIFIEPVYGDAEYRKSIENQAIGRVNRIGQERNITIIKYIVKDTIEEEIHSTF